jgi:hypothetical protein
MALQAVVDDSGRGNPPVFVLAGLAAKVEKWLGFPGAWDSVLKLEPKLAYFKMNDAHMLTGEFRGFSVAQRDQRLDAFVDVIEGHVEFAFRLVIPHVPYSQGLYGKIAKVIDQPYFLAFYRLMIFLLENEYNKPLGEKIDFVFDEQQQDELWVQSAYDGFVKCAPARLRHLIGDRPSHRSYRTFLPLQAADLYAWHVRRAFEARENGQVYSSSVWQRLESIPCKEDILDSARIANITTQLSETKEAQEIVFPYDLPLKLRKRALAELKRLRGVR